MSFSQVESGLEFILKHLSGPKFPRDIMVPTRKGQRPVSYKDVVMSHYEGALWVDCRISAFYPGQKNPDLIFIDMDRKDFKSDRAFKTALTKILKRIKKKIGGRPTVLWSGRGYHVIQPVKCDVDLDTIKQFSDLIRDRDKDKDVNKAFLQFASSYLSNGKKDLRNRTSLKSCLLRIPGSHNSRCKEEGTDPEVKIIQEWDGFRPDFRLLLGNFYSHLVAEKIKEMREREKSANVEFPTSSRGEGGVTWWIEKLLDTPIDDYRKRTRDLILVPYLVVRRGMTDADGIVPIVMKWADRCDELRYLDPSRREFEKEVESRVYEVIDGNMIPPMRFDTLREQNPELAKKLKTT